MVTRLSVADAVALNTQSPTTPAHTVAMIVLEASEQLSHQRLSRHVAAALPRLSRFRSRLVDKPLGVGQPVWAEVDDYDPTGQISSVTLAAPGGERELADLVTRLSAAPLDRRGALWQAWTIDGLAAGRWALAVKMSPVLAGAPMWEHLLSARPNATDDHLPTEAGPGPAPSMGGQLTDVLNQLVENQVTGVYVVADSVTGVLGEIRRRLGATHQPVATPPASTTSGPVPRTAFNAPLTGRRSMGLASIPISDVKTVSDAFGGNTANVVLAACTMSLRAWLQRYDVVPDEPLLMEVPLTAPAGDPADGRCPSAVGQVHMPVQLDDPVQILSNLHTATERLNIANRHVDEKVDPAVDLASFISMIPPSVAHAGMRIYSGLGMGRWRVPRCHGTVSFVSAHEASEYCAGAEVTGMYAAEPLVEGRGLNITVITHAEVMNVCVGACPDNVPEVAEIASGIAEAMQELVAAAATSPRGQGRSVVTEMNSHHSRR